MSKVILITGASSGMGKTTATLLAKEGYTVYAAARRLEKMEDLEKQGIHTIAMDVTDADATERGVSAILAAEGHIDILINNAGFGSYGAVEDVSLDDARYQLEVNVLGAARLIQLVLPQMRRRQQGRIINISSIGGKFATPLGGWYHASKFALEALSDSLRSEVKPFGIDVVVIEPGGVQSEWGEIAVNNLMKVSGNTAYGKIATRFAALAQREQGRAAAPEVIARLIAKALRVRKPKTRYHGGFLSGTMLLLRKILPDHLLDRIIMLPLKS